MGGARFIEVVHTLTKQSGTGGLNCGFWAFAQEATRTSKPGPPEARVSKRPESQGTQGPFALIPEASCGSAIMSPTL